MLTWVEIDTAAIGRNIEAFRSIDQLSPVEGLRTVILLPFGRIRDRRLRPRSAP